MSGQLHPEDGTDVTVTRDLGTVHPLSSRWSDKPLHVNAHANGTMQVTLRRQDCEALYLMAVNSATVTEPALSLLRMLHESGQVLGHPPLRERHALRLEGDPE